MNKNEIVEAVAHSIDFSKKDTEIVIDRFLDVIVECLENNDKAVLSGFGTFELRQRVGRTGVNPRTGEPIEIDSQKTAAFKVGKIFKERIR